MAFNQLPSETDFVQLVRIKMGVFDDLSDKVALLSYRIFLSILEERGKNEQPKQTRNGLPDAGESWLP